MLRISALFVILFVLGTVLCDGHGGNHMGGFLGMMGLGKNADAVMCKPENLNDDKLDQFRVEMEACGIDECAAQADDISALQKSENKLMARIHCSEKYRACLKEKHHKGKGGEEGQEPNEAAMKEWKEKMAVKKECVKAAFEKVFGPIGA